MRSREVEYMLLYVHTYVRTNEKLYTEHKHTHTHPPPPTHTYANELTLQ